MPSLAAIQAPLGCRNCVSPWHPLKPLATFTSWCFHDLPHMACVLSQTPWPLGKVCYSFCNSCFMKWGQPKFGSCSKSRHASNKDSKLGCPRPQWNLNCSGFKSFSACGFDHDPPPSRHNLGGSFQKMVERTHKSGWISFNYLSPNPKLFRAIPWKIPRNPKSSAGWGVICDSRHEFWPSTFQNPEGAVSYPKMVPPKIDLSMCYVGPTYSQYLYKTLDRNTHAAKMFWKPNCIGYIPRYPSQNTPLLEGFTSFTPFTRFTTRFTNQAFTTEICLNSCLGSVSLSLIM